MFFLPKELYYGIKALTFLVKERSASIKKISQKEKIPLYFLEKIFQKLKKRGLLASQKGVRGGYSLLLEPSKVNLKKIIECLKEDKFLVLPCFNFEKNFFCSKLKSCHLKRGWKKLLLNLESVLEITYLKDFLK